MTDIRLYLASLVIAMGLGAVIGALVVTPDLVDSIRAGVAPRVVTLEPAPSFMGIPLQDAWDAEAELRYRQEIEELRGEIDTLDMSLEDAQVVTAEARALVPTTPIELTIIGSGADDRSPARVWQRLANHHNERADNLENLVSAQDSELRLAYEQNDVLSQALEVATNRVDSLTGRKVRWGLGVTAGLPVVNRSGGANFTAVFGVTLMWG